MRLNKLLDKQLHKNLQRFAAEDSVNSRLDRQLHKRLRRLAAESSVNERLDEQLHNKLLTLAAEATVNETLDERMKSILLGIQLTGGVPIPSPEAPVLSQEPQEPSLQRGSLAGGEKPPTKEEQLAIKFADLWTRASAATERHDLENAKKLWAQVDEVSQQMHSDVDKQFIAFFLAAMGYSALNALIGLAGEGMIEALPWATSEEEAVKSLLDHFLARKLIVGCTKGFIILALDGLKGVLLGHRLPSLSSPAAKDEGLRFYKAIGFTLLVGLAEWFEFAGLEHLLDSFEIAEKASEDLESDSDSE